ncbi:MAG TPA: DUF4124 domain-containing protein [Xanthomonadaceae bacterium]|jgi:hypothetical protein|nr:DUF4124 domain-containing protein [Xanthomonadaceae bacterium]
MNVLRMNVLHKTLAAAVLLLFVQTALAQQAPSGPKLYRWVGPDGKVHYSDELPPEVLDQARQELSVKSGMTINQVDRAQTADERSAAQAKADAEAKAAAATQKAKESDQNLLSSYPTEADLKSAYDQRIAMQNETLKTTRIGMQSQQESLSELLIAASNLELASKPVPARMATTIRTTHAQVLDEQQQETQQEAQAANLRQENAAVLARYRSLRSATEAEHAATPTAPAGTPPSG